MTYVGIILTYVFVSNLVLSQFLGLCPFIGVSKNTESAVGMGFAVTFVMSLATLITWALQHFILIPLNIVFLQTVTFILVIASLVQLVEMAVRKYSPPLYQALGIYLPLITTNCGVLGIALISVNKDYSAMESFLAGLSAGIGFLLALLFMSGIRERLDTENVPKYLKGTPIAFISGGLMALAFMAFDQALLSNLIGG
ncbi:MAG: electron transport complex protein RnfA [Spirochaetaceae bacterium]|nr:electron transport complex protein RnfA [Spirochaetaceae bacterium]MDT8297922.1 electron transport complex protein RnfA [Spirochaetaceae bacterium]